MIALHWMPDLHSSPPAPQPQQSALTRSLLLHPHPHPPLSTPQGIFTPEDCVGEFPSDGALTYLEWNIIGMAAGVLTGSAVADVEACQLACKTDLTCQYFAFYDYNPDGTNNCFLRLAAAPIAKTTFDVRSPSTNFICHHV
jgi:hypothetical protein